MIRSAFVPTTSATNQPSAEQNQTKIGKDNQIEFVFLIFEIHQRCGFAALNSVFTLQFVSDFIQGKSETEQK